MKTPVHIWIDGNPAEVDPGSVVAAVLEQRGIRQSRVSVTGEPRTVLCGMGICFECRVTINGQPHMRGCLALCEEGMEIRTG